MSFNEFQFKLYRLPLAVFLALLTILIFESPVSASEKASTQAPSISAGSEIGYPPFCLVGSDGDATGFSVELMRAALKAMGREVTFRTGPWADVKGWLEQGQVQALPLVGRTPEREPIFDFTFPYISLHGAIVVREGTTGISNLDDLKGRDVAVMRGDNAEEFLRRKDRGITIHTTVTFEEALDELSRGLHDAVVIQRLLVLRILQGTGLANLRIISQPIDEFRQDFCFAVREGDRDMLAILNEGLSLVIADGTYRALHAKWFAALELPSNRHIVIGGDRDYPPFEFLDEKRQPAGYNVDLTRAIAQEEGLAIEIRLNDWAKTREALKNGEIDAVQGMFYSAKRDQDFDFSQPYTVINHVAVVRRGSGDPPATVSDLSGKRIVVMNGDIMHDFAVKNRLDDSVTVVETQEVALRELAQGKHDCALVARIPALFWIKKQGWNNLVVGRSSILSAEYCYAVPKGRKALLAKLSEGINAIEASGEYRRINEKWLGVYKDSPTNFVSFLRYAAIFIAPLLLLLLSVFLWSWSLRRQVFRRTAELEKSQKILNETGRMGKIGGWEHDLFTGKALWTEALRDIIGIPYNQEPPGVTEHLRYYPLRDQKILEQAYNQAIEDGTPFDLELEVLTAKNERIWCRVQGQPEFENDKCVKMRGTFQDITDRKRAEEESLRSERRLRTLVNTIPDLIWLKDLNGVYLGCNPTFERFFGAKESAIIGKTDYDFVDKELADFFREHDRRAMAAGRPSINEEWLTFADNGYKGLFETIKSPMSDADGNLIGVLGIARDISEREKSEKEKIRLERQLKQSQKMESIGKLAGGIAHDFNNILSSVIGFTELALDDVAKGTPMEDNLQEVYTAGKRARDLVKQILAFARQSDEERKPIRLGTIAEEVIKLVRSTIPTSIEIRSNINSRSLIMGSSSQAHQLFLNLCTNAAHAMDSTGGILEITLEDVELDAQSALALLELKPGKYIKITISDTGSGISPDIIGSIFEPYFTTKGVGEGTGMGLALVHGIVESYEGKITVESELGKGTVFSIYLPVTKMHEDYRPYEQEDQPSGTEHILFVDDELPIAKMGRQVLEGLGYRVTVRTSSVEALELFCAKPHSFDLVISDMTMPNMTGEELAMELIALRPDISVILCTGYSKKITDEKATKIGIKAFAYKPIVKADLAKTVRRVLDEAKKG